MTLQAIYSSPATPTSSAWSVDVAGKIRLGSVTGVPGEAELGATGEGNCIVDDTDGTAGHSSDGFVGLKQWALVETACPAGNQRLWTGYTSDRTYRRGTTPPSGTASSLITTVAREIDISLVDLNWFLSFRVFAPTADDPTSDFDRPAETDLERVQALLTTVDFISTTLFDIGYIPTTGGIAMDAKNYEGSKPIDVLNDCAQVSGRNFFVLYDEASNQFVLWYDVPTTDGTATKTYDSALRLSNVLSEIDDTTTFAASASAKLDPSRLISAVYLPYDGGTVYRTLASTANTYAWRDAVMPSIQVKSVTAATSLAARYLGDNATEDERISATVRIPNTKVTGIHEGMRIQVHFTHIPNVQSDFTWCRILQRTIRQDQETEEFYWLDLELSPIGTSIAANSYMCGAYTVAESFSSQQVFWQVSGGSCGVEPLAGLVEFIGTIPALEGWRALANMTNFSFHAVCRSVPGGATELTAVLNGNLVTGTIIDTVAKVGDYMTMDATVATFNTGDEITFWFTPLGGLSRGVLNNAATGASFVTGGLA